MVYNNKADTSFQLPTKTTVMKLNEWLGEGEARTLVVSRSFVSPPLDVNGRPLYISTEERDKYYIDSGIWQKTEFMEYDIKSISWVHKELPSYLAPIPSGGGTYLEPQLLTYYVLSEYILVIKLFF